MLKHFGKDDILDAERTNCNCETCNSYNMLKLSRELFKITGDNKYMDYYENTYYNSILSSQNPETGMTTYFQPMATGYFKVYSTPFKNFWCCTGSGMESFTKLGDTMYMHKDNTLYVNYYQSSVLNWREHGVTITQNNTIPEGNSTSFQITGSGNFNFHFRLPDWKAGNVLITVNGSRYSYETVRNYAVVSGNFKSGDTIELTIPMEVKAYSLPDSEYVYGFKYGPVVLSAELGTDNMKQTTTGMSVSIPADKVVSNEKITLNESSGSVGSFMLNINEYLVKDQNSLKFSLKGTDTLLTFTPHYKQYKQRYGIYWYSYSSVNVSEDDIPRAKVTVTDTVQPGYGQYENDELHAMEEKNSVSVTNDSTYRYAVNGGYFNYRMAVDESAPYTILQVTFRKSDNGKPIVITAGDRIIYDRILKYSGNEDTYNVRIIIPSYVIKESIKTITANETLYDVIDIGFSSGSKSESAKICDFIYMNSVKPYYEYDTELAYFVDCGDHSTKTATGNDKFGYYNCLTEQIYGEDSVTGVSWGLIDDENDQYGGSLKSKGIYTANTWCDEYNTADGQDKMSSYRYTKNQYENKIERHIDYGFTLPNGTYHVEVGFADPWGCSNKPSVYAYYGTENVQTLTENLDLSDTKTAIANVKVTDGNLLLNFRSEDKAINITYIKIYFDTIEELPYKPVITTQSVTSMRMGHSTLLIL